MTAGPDEPNSSDPQGAAFAVDLHCHTTTSDGAWPPDRVIAAARARGIEVLAFTDHDVGNDPELVRVAQHAGLQLVPGIELMTMTAAFEKVDIIGLGIDWGEPAGRDYAAHIRDGQLHWTDRIVARLEQVLGETVDRGAMLARAGKPFLHEGNLYGELAQRGVFEFGWPYREFRAAWTMPGRPLHEPVPGKITPHQGVALAHRLGGLAVLTVSDMEPAQWRATANDLAQVGLDAIEICHPHLDLNQRAVLAELAADLDLLVTGGSDFHHPDRGLLGDAGLSRAQAEPLLRRLRS